LRIYVNEVSGGPPDLCSFDDPVYLERDSALRSTIIMIPKVYERGWGRAGALYVPDKLWDQFVTLVHWADAGMKARRWLLREERLRNNP